MVKRSQARVLAFQAIYQLDVQGQPFLAEAEAFLKADSPPSEVFDYARSLLSGTAEQLDQIDAMLESAAQHWELHRLAAVDRSILRLAIYELCYLPDMPNKVAIDEAIEMAKRYSTRQSPSFVNGVLDAILKMRAKD